MKKSDAERELTGILEWQAKIAFATKDYWQARLLAMQWEILDGDNPNLEALKQDIVRVLGYRNYSLSGDKTV
jgi:hypothetical protein